MGRNEDERSPEQWREILRNSVQIPQEARTGSRRQRRQAKAIHHRQARQHTAQWIKEQRRREPLRPAGAAIIVALILALGLGARWLWPGLNGTSHHPGSPSPAASTAAPATVRPAPAGTAPTASDSVAPAVDRSDPNKVVQQAVRLYLTRDPMKDRTHQASIDRAAPYLEAALADNLQGHADPEWDKLNSQSANATVTAVTVGPAGTDLPPDNPLRVWRTATTTLDIKGYTETTQTTTLQLEVTNDGAGQWRISRILGL